MEKKNVLDEVVKIELNIKDYFDLKLFLGDFIRTIVLNDSKPIGKIELQLLDVVQHLYEVIDKFYKGGKDEKA